MYYFGKVILIYYEKLIKQTSVYYISKFDWLIAAGR